MKGVDAVMVCDAIERRLNPPGSLRAWCVEREATMPSGRRMDVVALGLWQSRGHAVMGFEVKVARADWLREVADHAKSDGAVEACDAFVVVAAKGVVVAESEVPAGWGWWEASLRDGKAVLRVRRAPAVRESDGRMARWLAARLCAKSSQREADVRREAEFLAGQVESLRKTVAAGGGVPSPYRQEQVDDARRYRALCEVLRDAGVMVDPDDVEETLRRVRASWSVVQTLVHPERVKGEVVARLRSEQRRLAEAERVLSEWVAPD